MNTISDKARGTEIIFWTTALALLFFKLGSTSPWQSEDRWLEIAREMIASGNYFKPTINGVIYFDKPLLSYWFEVLIAAVIGGFNEWAMRIPSAIAALVTLWATIDLGRRLWSEKIGLLAGWILLTGFGFLQWGRLAEADMENLAFTLVAVNWYWRQRDVSTFSGYAIFYLIIAVGAQCKGLTAVVVPLLALLPDMLNNQRWRQHINRSHILALLFASVVYLLPFLLATSSTTTTVTTSGHSSGLGLVIRENIVRYFAPFDHVGPIYTYLIAIPQFMFPWSPVLIAALIACYQKRFREQVNVGWILWSFTLIFLFFTLSGSRRGYYILPILPYGALLSARFLLDNTLSASLRRWSLNITAALLILFSLLQLLTPLLWPTLEQRLGTTLPAEFKLMSLVIGGFSLLSFLALFLWRRREEDSVMIAITASSVVLWSGLFFWQQPAFDHYRTEVPFARGLKALGANLSASQIAIYHKQPSGRLLYYSELPLPIQQIDRATQLQTFMDTGPYPKLILAESKYQNELPESLRNQTPDLIETQYGWEKDGRDKIRAWKIISNEK